MLGITFASSLCTCCGLPLSSDSIKTIIFTLQPLGGKCLKPFEPFCLNYKENCWFYVEYSWHVVLLSRLSEVIFFHLGWCANTHAAGTMLGTVWIGHQLHVLTACDQVQFQGLVCRPMTSIQESFWQLGIRGSQSHSRKA